MMQQANAEFKVSALGLRCGLPGKPAADSAGLQLSSEQTAVPR